MLLFKVLQKHMPLESLYDSTKYLYQNQNNQLKINQNLACQKIECVLYYRMISGASAMEKVFFSDIRSYFPDIYNILCYGNCGIKGECICPATMAVS